MYIGLHIKYPSFLLGFGGTRNFVTVFEKYSNIKFHENLSIEIGVVAPYVAGLRSRHDNA
jgi:hypothetical protein